MSRVSTDGCSELTCPYHGEENRRKLAALDELRLIDTLTKTEKASKS